MKLKKVLNFLKKGYQIVKRSKSSSSGGASVGFSIISEIIHQISDNIKKNVDTEMMWKFLKIFEKN